jgi:glycosyltransferase involved in cell wall biosynthesis
MVESITPLVSVIIPAFNGEKTIEKTVSSILTQNFSPFELIVIDDGSSDATVSIAELTMSKAIFSGDFTLIRHESNMGLSKTLNDGVKRARGRFVLILHQDCEFVGADWIAKASSLMVDEHVAVVTGYYGLSAIADETFVKRAFGVLRKQFHSRPQISCEEVTFSEGKCDLYRKESLVEAGAFPTAFRIAGEDLIVSYKLRSLGYTILKCYDLPVIQRFTGAAETFSGNLGKEFLFGKVMGGVFSEFKLFLFKALKNSKYSGSRSLHRASQPVFVLALSLSGLFALVLSLWFVIIVFLLVGYRYLYYINRVYQELKTYCDRLKNPLQEMLAISGIGILTDFAYSFGFSYGLATYALRRRL